MNGLAGRRGSVVAIVPSTGEVRAMVSIPEYDPNQIPKNFAQLNREPARRSSTARRRAGYPPGSTMKVVTATAALDSGELTPSSTFSGRSPIEIEGVPLGTPAASSSATIDMTTALTNSVNTWWAQAGEKIGKDAMFKYMDRYGFDAKPRSTIRASSSPRAASMTGTGCSDPVTRSTSGGSRSARSACG